MEKANAGAVAGIDEPGQVSLDELISRKLAAALEGSPLVQELKAKLKAAEEKNATLEAEKAVKQMADLHRTGANESHASTKERWAVTVDEARDKNEIDPVFLSVNGRAYLLKRGKRVEVPREVVEVLNHAVQTISTTIFDERTGIAIGADSRNARRFPYQMHGKAVDKDGARLMPIEGSPQTTMD